MIEREVKPYPYAYPETIEFLKAVIAEGAHIKRPKGVNEDKWIRNKNITAIYFSCDITKEEFAGRYGTSKQLICQIIEKTTRTFWNNLPFKAKCAFSKNLPLQNPRLGRLMPGAERNVDFLFRSLIGENEKDQVVSDKLQLPINRVRQVLRAAGRNDLITTRQERLKGVMSILEYEPVGNYEERQRAMDQMTLAGYKSNRGSFASISDVVAGLGRQLPKGGVMSSDRFIDELREMKVPVGVCVAPCSLKKGSGVGKRNIFVHKKDFYRLQEMRGNSTNLS